MCNKDGVRRTEQIWLGEIDEYSALEFHERAMYQFLEDPNRPIIIFIDSPGGSVNALFSILDTMDAIRDMTESKIVFITCAHGIAMSAGALILAYGDLRLASPRSTIMLHQARVNLPEGDIQDSELDLKLCRRYNKQVLDVIKTRSRFKGTIAELKAKLTRNLYMTAQEAVKFGIVDKVGYPKVQDSVRTSIYVMNDPKYPKQTAIVEED